MRNMWQNVYQPVLYYNIEGAAAKLYHGKGKAMTFALTTSFHLIQELVGG